ncbi:MAG: hypothetical protein ACOYBY_11570 [Dermatophilaceae bacterium]
MTARRLAINAVGMLAALVLVASCTAVRLPGAAAIIDGQPITTQDVATTTDQINGVIQDPSQHFTETQTVYWLVIAPFVNEKAAATGRWTPDEAFNTVLAAIPNPTEQTVAVVKAQSAANALTQQDVQGVLAQIEAADIQIDPRFGSIDTQTGAWVKPDPNWIKPTATATRAATP